MGHYASEMACSTCHQCRCTCPPPPDRTLEQWVVDSNYVAMRAPDFDAKYGFSYIGPTRYPDKAAGTMRRMVMTHFETQAQAEAHALDRLTFAILKSEEQTALLKARLAELQKA